MKLQLLLLIFGSLTLCLNSFSQEKDENNLYKENKPQVTDIPVVYSLNDLEFNGINSSKLSTLSNDDIEKLKYFDFSPYRLYAKSQKVQLENGPIIEIYSVEKMVLMGNKFEESYIISKKDVDNSTLTHSIIPLVNIGFGKIAAEELH